MSDTDDATGDQAGSPVATAPAPAPIDTSDAASADGPSEQMSGRVRTAIAVGPFLFIWLLWWRLGDVFLHREQEAKVPEWIHEVPRSFTVDWFNFAGRERGHRASGWVNTWFDHMRYEELLSLIHI